MRFLRIPTPKRVLKRHTRKITRKVHPAKVVKRQARKLNPVRKLPGF